MCLKTNNFVRLENSLGDTFCLYRKQSIQISIDTSVKSTVIEYRWFLEDGQLFPEQHWNQLNEVKVGDVLTSFGRKFNVVQCIDSALEIVIYRKSAYSASITVSGLNKTMDGHWIIQPVQANGHKFDSMLNDLEISSLGDKEKYLRAIFDEFRIVRGRV